MECYLCKNHRCPTITNANTNSGTHDSKRGLKFFLWLLYNVYINRQFWTWYIFYGVLRNHGINYTFITSCKNGTSFCWCYRPLQLLAKLHSLQALPILIYNKCISDGLMHVAVWHRRTLESKFTKIFHGMLLTKAPNQPKFCRNRLKMWDISAIKNLCSWKSEPKFTKISYDLLLPKAPIMPNFIEIGETTLEKSATKYFYTLQYFGSLGHKSPVCVETYTNPL